MFYTYTRVGYSRILLAMTTEKPTVIHIGDEIRHNPEIYERFSSQFNVIRIAEEERQRPAFIESLKQKKWGNFQAIFRPFWNTGGEMGQWDEELVSLLPDSVKIFASAGAGYDWACTDVLAEHGEYSYLLCSDLKSEFTYVNSSLLTQKYL